jgi:hypothetical protein
MSNKPQMPPLSQDELDSFLALPLLARICTLNKDGSIHIAPLLFKQVDGYILLGTQDISRKARNVSRNPNVTVMIDDPIPPAKGVLIYGEAVLDYEDVSEKRVAIFEKYGRSREQAAATTQALAGKWKAVIIRVRPRRFVSFDYSKGSLI